MWSIANGSVTVSFTPLSGEIEQNYEIPTGVFWPLRGSDPVIQYGPVRKPSITTPQWLIQGDTAKTQMIAVLGPRKRLTLTDDTTGVKYVKVIGSYSIRTQDTPDRDTNPRYIVTVTLQEVS